MIALGLGDAGAQQHPRRHRRVEGAGDERRENPLRHRDAGRQGHGRPGDEAPRPPHASTRLAGAPVERARPDTDPGDEDAHRPEQDPRSSPGHRQQPTHHGRHGRGPTEQQLGGCLLGQLIAGDGASAKPHVVVLGGPEPVPSGGRPWLRSCRAASLPAAATPEAGPRAASRDANWRC